MGNLTVTDRGFILVMASVCYGYNSGDDLYGQDKGCELWEQPKCLKQRQVVDLRSGYFTYANTTPVPTNTNTSAGLSLSDCRDACWKWDNCECAGYQGGDGYCSYWIGRHLKWEQDNSGNSPKSYVFLSSPKGTLLLARFLI